MKSALIKILLILGAILPIIRLSQDGVSSILIFSVFVVIYLWKGLQNFYSNLPLPLSFKYILSGTFFGGLTQLFVQLEGAEKSFSADPTFHFLQALTIYFFVTVTWYFLLKKYNLSAWSIFWVTGVWGAIVEGLILNGALNPLIWIFLFIVYGSFAVIPFILTEAGFSQMTRQNPTAKNYLKFFVFLSLVIIESNALIFIMSLFGVK